MASRVRLWTMVVFCAAASCLSFSSAHAVTIDLVTVGNAGNANDTTGYGAVNYDYRIGKYEVTIQQYTDFLNAVAKTDTYLLYNGAMASNGNIAGIGQGGAPGNLTYSVLANAGNSGNRPITYVNWWAVARFANWMANGQPTGPQDATTTENGAYAVNGNNDGNVPNKNAINPNTGLPPTFYMPTENEWYKAAYYSPTLNGGAGGYYTFATQSNDFPGNTMGSGVVNQANYNNGVYAVTGSADYVESQNYLTNVGAFSDSPSYYGTFDQSGNVYEWNDLTGTTIGNEGGVRGGNWFDIFFPLQSSRRSVVATSSDLGYAGFRLAAPVAVPEPSTYAVALAGIACGGFSMWRRRK
ncbi:MAG: formylglycine-generating enzyme family protein [Planctomycetia bacterium]